MYGRLSEQEERFRENNAGLCWVHGLWCHQQDLCHMRSLSPRYVPACVLIDNDSLNGNICYFVEVARTRLREAGSKYRSFWQTLRLVYREEGRRGLYRGLGTQLVRQIPNTAIMMATYELTVYMLRQAFYE